MCVGCSHHMLICVQQGWTKFYEFGLSDLRSSAELVDRLFIKAGLFVYLHLSKFCCTSSFATRLPSRNSFSELKSSKK